MAKARRRLSDLVQEETQKVRDLNLQTSEVTEPVSLPEALSKARSVEGVTDQQTDNLTDLQTLEVLESVPSMAVTVGENDKQARIITETQSLEATNLQSNELPKYLKLERKEARLRQDQIDALTDLTRKLNRMKRSKGGERLTDNTLIRVALDLLLSKASELQGTTEEELRSSLNL